MNSMSGLRVRHCIIMRRAFVSSIVIIIALVLFSGCGSKRDLSTPENAIIGHWVCESGNAEYFFNRNTYIMVDHRRDGLNVFEVPYKVLSSDAERNWIRIGVVEEEDSEFWHAGEISIYREIIISKDGTSFYEGIAFDCPETGESYEKSIELTQRKWLFVDNQIEPSGWEIR